MVVVESVRGAGLAEDQGLLSQEEIDSLLKAISTESEKGDSGSTAAPKTDNVKRYDFRRPDRFSKEQMRALRMIHENWARRISISLSAYLRTSGEVNLADIDQGAYTTLVQQLPDQGVYYIISLFPLPGHFMLYVSLDLALVMIDRMMGGPGIPFKRQSGLSDLEIELLKMVSDKILADLQAAWEGTVSMRPRIDDISLNLLMTPIALPTDAVVLVSFEVRMKGNVGAMVLALPYSVLKPISNTLSPYTWVANAQPEMRTGNTKNRDELQAGLNKVRMPVSVLLGSANLSVEELTSLEPGDVLPLDTATDSPVQVLINGATKFLGRPGLHGRKLSVQLSERIEREIPFSEQTELSRIAFEELK
jgi:flagellar motor switch protein FliM